MVHPTTTAALEEAHAMAAVPIAGIILQFIVSVFRGAVRR
jgi:hypothetical protein